MSPKNINDRIRLLSIVDSYGERGATLPEIQADWRKLSGGRVLEQKQFIRSRKDIKELCGVDIRCRKAKSDSRYYVCREGSESFLRMSALNTVLLQDIIGDGTFPKGRIFIDEAYNNDHVRVVSAAISRGSHVLMIQKRLSETFTSVDWIFSPSKVERKCDTFELIPLALCFLCKWFVIGRKPSDEENSLLVYSLNNTMEVSPIAGSASATEDLDLQEVLKSYNEVFPITKEMNNPDDRLDFICSMATSSFKLF